jgi:hypothetical protein
MKIEEQKEKVLTLLELIKQYPDYEIVPMVATECVFDDSFGYWMGEWGSARVTKYWCGDERIYQYDDFDELVEEFVDNNYEYCPEIAKEYVNSLDWKDAIVVYIEHR